MVDVLVESLSVVGVYQTHICATPMLPQGSSCNSTAFLNAKISPVRK